MTDSDRMYIEAKAVADATMFKQAITCKDTDLAKQIVRTSTLSRRNKDQIISAYGLGR